MSERKRAEDREKKGDNPRVNLAIAALKALGPGEWEDVMQHFCHACGGESGCQCWNDE